jgi:hypothetical protein
LTASANPVLVQNAVTLTATITSPVGTPTGSVVFSDSGNPLSTANLIGGVATVTLSTLTAGSHTITAIYSGDANFNSATTPAVSEMVEDFTLASGGTSSQTIQPGGTATFNFPFSLTVGAILPAAVTLSVSGQPSGATYTFAPSSLAAGSDPTSFTLSVQAPQTAMLEQRTRSGASFGFVVTGMLLAPFFGRLRRSRKWLQRAAILVVLASGVATLTSLTGCGGGSSAGSSNPSP